MGKETELRSKEDLQPEVGGGSERIAKSVLTVITKLRGMHILKAKSEGEQEALNLGQIRSVEGTLEGG